MPIETDTITLPTHWAVCLINGDESYMSDEEIEAMNAVIIPLEKEGWHVVDMIEESKRFTWSYYAHGGTAKGGEVAEYTIMREVQ